VNKIKKKNSEIGSIEDLPQAGRPVDNDTKLLLFM
jgi:hypothetical protein